MTHCRSPLCLAGLLLAFVLALGSAPLGRAQTIPLPGTASEPDQPSQQAEPGSQETLDRLIEAIEDPDTRAKLLDALRAAQASDAPDAGGAAEPRNGPGGALIESIADTLSDLGVALVAVGQGFEALPQFGTWLRFQVSEPALRERWLALAVAFLVGGAAYSLIRLLVRRLRPEPPGQRPEWGVRVVLLLVRLGLDALPIAAFVLASYACLLAVSATPSGRLVVIALTNAVAVVLGVLALGRLVLSPDAPGLRPVRIADETAHYLRLWLRRFAVVVAFGWGIAEIARLLGLNTEAYVGVVKLVGAIVAILACVFVLQNRHGVAQWLEGHRRTEGRGLLATTRLHTARLWHIAAMIYIAAAYLIWAADINSGGYLVIRATGLSAIVLIAARLIDGGTRAALARAAAVSLDASSRFPELERRANRYLPSLQSLRSLVIWFAALVVVLQLWGFDSIVWLTSGTGRSIVLDALTVILVVALAMAAWEAVNAAIDRYLAPPENETTERSARIRTMLPLARNVALVFIVVMTGLIVLSELGVNTAPLLAGAGVVGLAIGFGSQALVKDLITGLFILLEDSVSVGDVATVGGHTGVVEAISIRTIRLRDLEGSVYSVPWSEVTSVTNLTKDFSYYLLDVGVAYRENTDEVVAVLKEISEGMRSESAFASSFLEPIEILGVDRFADSAVVIRARIKTPPLKQWTVGREFNRRMKLRFDELGIEIPFPHTTIYFGEDRKGEAPAARVMVSQVSELPAPKPASGAQTGEGEAG